jgi:ribonuclease P protein component
VTGRPSGGRSPKRRRLSRSAEFERVYRQGRSKSNRFLVLYAFPREEEAAGGDGHGRGESAAGPRLGLSVSRRVGGAVDRTRVKRVLREAFWAEAERLPDGSDYVVVARPDARELAEREGMAGMRGALAELVDALGAARPGRTAADGSGAPAAGRRVADGSMPAGSGDPPPAETPAGPSSPGTAG